MAKKEVKVDSRETVSLRGIRTQKHDWYFIEELPDGRIIMEPAVLVTANRIIEGEKDPPDRKIPYIENNPFGE